MEGLKQGGSERTGAAARVASSVVQAADAGCAGVFRRAASLVHLSFCVRGSDHFSLCPVQRLAAAPPAAAQERWHEGEPALVAWSDGGAAADGAPVTHMDVRHLRLLYRPALLQVRGAGT